MNTIKARVYTMEEDSKMCCFSILIPSLLQEGLKIKWNEEGEKGRMQFFFLEMPLVFKELYIM